MHASICVHVDAHIRVCMYVCYVYVLCVYVHVCVFACVCTCMCVCTCVCMCVSVCTMTKDEHLNVLEIDGTHSLTSLSPSGLITRFALFH